MNRATARLRVALGATIVLLATTSVWPQSAQSLPYRNAALPIDARVDDLLGRMTLEEKFWQLFMIPGDLDNPANDYSHGIFGLQMRNIGPIPGTTGRAPAAAMARRHTERMNEIQRYFVDRTRLGVPIVFFEEGVHGLTVDGATMFPQAIALAASWDVGLMDRVANAIADEAKTRGIRDVLSPVINIADDVRWGRVEETYGEDPFLTTAMTLAFVRALEQKGIVATPKHFIANVGEGGRDSYPIEHSERLLTERYFPPFLAAIKDAGARSIMTSYNAVNGLPATQNPRLLNGIVKGEWGFKGFIISDQSAVGGSTVLLHTEPTTTVGTAHALAAGLDVIFQSSYGQQRPYLDAFQQGLIAPDVIDAAVRRVLRVKFELGLFERPYGDPDAAAATNGSDAHRELARDAARRGVVLLKNERGVLPLSKQTRSVAVIGADAEQARLGGYSSPGSAAPVSILEGIRLALGSPANVRYAAGPGRSVRDLVVVPANALTSASPNGNVAGLRGEYLDNPRLEGAPRLSRTDARLDFRWTLNAPGRGIPFDWYSARWTGAIVAPTGGATRIGIEGNDGYRLYLDGRLAIDNWRKVSFGRRVADVQLVPGSRHDLRVEYFETTGNARVRLIWDGGVKEDSTAAIAEAVAVARQSDVALVVAGVDEGEFQDRARLSLPGRQEELIQQIAATGKPTIVVLIGGSAITMTPWLDRVDGVLDAWYPGEAGGLAVADVLFGDVNPAGRLPVTFPVFEGQLPLSYNHKPTGRGDDYVDLTGMALFPFGFGLSYTTFDYSDLRITPDAIGPDGTVSVSCVVQNTGTRAGDEVVQLYLRDLIGSVARPIIELKGFHRVSLAPGARAPVRFSLSPSELRFLGADMKWTVEPGTFRVLVGASSKDIRLRGEFTVR